MGLLDRFRGINNDPLPPMRPTSDILGDIDRQVGRLSKVRERAAELIIDLEAESDAAGT